MDGMVSKEIIPQGWHMVRSIHIKGSNTAALPVWMTDELWAKKEDVIEDHEADELAKQREKKYGKRKGRALDAEAEGDGDQPKRIKADAEQKSERAKAFDREHEVEIVDETEQKDKAEK